MCRSLQQPAFSDWCCCIAACCLLVLQSVPQWSCVYQVAGSASATISPAAVASYLAKTVTAGGQEFCAGQPSASGFCDATAGVTGLCATAPSNSSSSFCRVMPVSKQWTMTATLASPGLDCPKAGKPMSADAISSFVTYLSGYMPGFSITLKKANKPLQCVQQYVSDTRVPELLKATLPFALACSTCVARVKDMWGVYTLLPCVTWMAAAT